MEMKEVIIGKDVAGATVDILKGLRAFVIGEREDGDLLIAVRADLYEEGMVARGDVDDEGVYMAEVRNLDELNDWYGEYEVLKYIDYDRSLYNYIMLDGYSNMKKIGELTVLDDNFIGEVVGGGVLKTGKVTHCYRIIGYLDGFFDAEHKRFVDENGDNMLYDRYILIDGNPVLDK